MRDLLNEAPGAATRSQTKSKPNGYFFSGTVRAHYYYWGGGLRFLEMRSTIVDKKELGISFVIY